MVMWVAALREMPVAPHAGTRSHGVAGAVSSHYRGVITAHLRCIFQVGVQPASFFLNNNQPVLSTRIDGARPESVARNFTRFLQMMGAASAAAAVRD